MSETTTKPMTFDDETYQRMCNATADAAYGLIASIHKLNGERLAPGAVSGDAGPVIAGVIGAIVRFVMEDTPLRDRPGLRDELIQQIDHIAEQIEPPRDA